MRQNGAQGWQGARGRVPTAQDRGWDDSLYDDSRRRPPHPQAAHHSSAPAAQAGGRDGRRGAAGGAGTGGPRRGRRVLRWTGLVLSLLILATAGAGYLYYRHLNGNLQKDDLNLGDSKLDRTGPNAAGQTPLNILLLGSDSRASAENVHLGGASADRTRPALADVQMLLHVSADRGSMSVLSIPRDTKATIPKCTDPDDGRVYPSVTTKINTSLQHGGPGCTVATWEEMTGIPVDHFMMIDFSGVVSMADAVGGVPVCVDKNVYDSKSGLRLSAGTHTVVGKQALQWLRTRHGFGDGTDIGRSRAQHMYMSAMVRQLKAGTKLSNPGQLRRLAETATRALTVDDGIGSVKKLYDLANDIKRVPTKRITMATMPWEYAPGGYVVPKPGDADHVFSLIRNDVALDGKDRKKPSAPHTAAPDTQADPAARITVRVQNGTGTALQRPVTGRAAAVAGYLGQQGFSRAAADSTPKSQADTTISYPDESQRANALAVAKALHLPEDAVRHSTGVQQVTLVVGADWRAGSTYPKQPAGGSGGAGDDKAPESADLLNGGDTTACMKVNPANVW